MVDLLNPLNIITSMFNAQKYNEMYEYCKDATLASQTE